ncbi:hypothetical protein [Terrimonas pollutisoli]|uniref:hypothetical protein n=1 Tax=Terrimonas pollutisoli TaxID=3034147 RepID=UPI0023ED7EE8|nr:hypothetical protein [Terrimonas sp. H1YJ31]
MSEQKMNTNEFYIGWMPNAPVGFAKHVRKVVIVLIVLVIAGGIILALQQKKFSTSGFEFGQLTEVKGIYQRFPIPSLKVMTRPDAFGNTSYITMPLVGYGKFGAEGVMAELEKEKNIILDKKEITLKGILIYNDGKTLLQIDKNDDPLLAASSSISNISNEIKELGTVQLTGEILDPKCYFGVMKPGHGKPHRDCAIRCIAGGISPVFWVRNENGETNYYLLLDENGRKLNEAIKDHIAEPVSLTARAVQHDDWVVLYVNKASIKRTGGLSWFKQQDKTISCGTSAR